MRAFIHKNRNSLICILAGLVLYIISGLVSAGGGIIIDGKYIERQNYGSADRKYELYVDGLDSEAVKVDVGVSNREYGEKEAEAAFENCMNIMPEIIAGENKSLNAIDSDLKLPSKIKEYGIRAVWIPEDTKLITNEGKINNADIKSPVETGLRVELSDGSGHRAEYRIALRVMPASYTETERLAHALENELKKIDRDTVESDRLELPQNIEGRKISYRDYENGSRHIIWVLGIVGAVLLHERDKERERKSAESRRRQLELDYPELLSRLMVFMGAGLSVRSAWERIVSDYDRSAGNERYAYEEMKKTMAQIKTGIHEGRAYRDFGRSCGTRQYMKLASLLEQNRKAGLSNILGILETELLAAWEERVNTARRMGEELGTKLLLPMFMMLGVVMAIIMVPAMLAFY